MPTVLMERRPRPGSALHALDSVCSDHWYGTHLAVGPSGVAGPPAYRPGRPRRQSDGAHHADGVRRDRGGPSGGGGLVDGAQFACGGARPRSADARRTGRGRARFDPDGDATAVDLAALLRERGATAAVLHGDVDALMLVQRLAEGGVQVPRDCSVVAYDDVVAALGSTPLTAVAPPKAEIGRAAAELLLHRLAGTAGATGPVRRTELLPTLKIRGSAQPIPTPED